METNDAVVSFETHRPIKTYPPFRFKLHVYITDCCIYENPKGKRRSNEKEANVLAAKISSDGNA